MDVRGAATEAGATGACAQCAIALGMDPILAPVAATVAVFLARMLLGTVERYLANRRAPARPPES